MTAQTQQKQLPKDLTPVSANEVEAVLGKPAQLIALKQSSYLDTGHQDLVRRSPIAGIGYLDERDQATSNFVGGTVGFAEILDDQRIAFSLPPTAKRPAKEARIGMVFLFPGVGETLRLNGRASSITNGHVVLAVEEVYIHCSRAVSRSGLWVLPARSVSEPATDLTPSTGEDALLAPLDAPNINRIMANAPFLILTSFGSNVSADTSPRGDAPGFVHKLSGNKLAIPDRKGNQRADTFHNLAIDQRISFAALVPGTAEIAVISGIAAMSTDPALLEQMALNATPPQAAIVVDVTSAHIETANELMAAGLWSERSRDEVETMPDMNALAAAQIARNAGSQSHRLLSLLLRGMNAIPGLMSALTRFGLNKALASEGYLTDRKASASGKHRARIMSVKREANDVVSLLLKRVDRQPFEFKPGQYFTIAVKVDGQIYQRVYSASDLAGPQLRLTIKRHPDGIVSNHLHHIRRGDIVEISGPNGTFTPVASTGNDDMVLIGAGSGITPLYAAAVAALKNSTRRVVLFYGCRNERDIIFHQSLQRLARKYKNRFIFRISLTNPSDTWTGRIGRISAKTLQKDLTEIGVSAHSTYWICGPDDMMANVTTTLRGLGIGKEKIRQERFARAEPSDKPTQAASVVIRKGHERIGVVTVGPEETILDAALADSIPMKYSCTIGDCGECVVRLLEGSVKMASSNCLSEAQVEDNIILTCIGRPTSDTVIDMGFSLNVEAAIGTGFETWKIRTPSTKE